MSARCVRGKLGEAPIWKGGFQGLDLAPGHFPAAPGMLVLEQMGWGGRAGVYLESCLVT